MEREHENARLGIVAAPKAITVTDAVAEWLKIREQGAIQNDKAKAMSSRLVEWCGEHDITYVPEITTPLAMQFRMSLPFRSGDSSSLKVHWSVIGGFFRWCKGMGYVAQSPVPAARENPQFRITFKKKEVVPPTQEEVVKVIDTATGKTKLLVQLMRWSGMAIGDAIFREKNKLEGNLIRGNRRKTDERFRVRVPQWLADSLPSFTDDIDWKSPVHYWEKQLRQVFKDAGVKMTPHHFRHFRITELLSSGVRVEDVALMVGTSPQEIRKTYQHWIRETEERLDEQQKQEFLSQGLDENGNQVIQ
jgi:integrase